MCSCIFDLFYPETPGPTFKAKSGNLSLFLRILPFFPSFSLYFAAKCAEKGSDYQILPFLTYF